MNLGMESNPRKNKDYVGKNIIMAIQNKHEHKQLQRRQKTETNNEYGGYDLIGKPCILCICYIVIRVLDI